MSALGQKQTSRHLQPMSALPPKADIGTQSWNVRFVPKADISQLLDQVVGSGEHRGWHREAECLGRFQVDDQFVFCRRLHRQISRLLALEDAIDVTGGAAVLIDGIWPIS